MAKKNENPEQAEPMTSLEEAAKKSVQIKFNITKILGMKRYANRVDLLRVLLKPDKTYALETVDAAIDDFMKGEVN